MTCFCFFQSGSSRPPSPTRSFFFNSSSPPLSLSALKGKRLARAPSSQARAPPCLSPPPPPPGGPTENQIRPFRTRVDPNREDTERTEPRWRRFRLKWCRVHVNRALSRSILKVTIRAGATAGWSRTERDVRPGPNLTNTVTVLPASAAARENQLTCHLITMKWKFFIKKKKKNPQRDVITKVCKQIKHLF